jgi:hypothetical protein
VQNSLGTVILSKKGPFASIDIVMDNLGNNEERFAVNKDERRAPRQNNMDWQFCFHEFPTMKNHKVA